MLFSPFYIVVQEIEMSDKTKSDLEPDAHVDFHSGNELIEPEESMDSTLLRNALAASKLELKASAEKLLRKEAELQNVQRLTALDLEKARKFGNERMAQELLAVADSFEQGLMYEKDNEALKNGMQLTYTLLLEVLAKFGIKEINTAVSDSFNPQCHEAISMQEIADMEPNKIVAVIQKGYFIHERILRAARVVVSRASVS